MKRLASLLLYAYVLGLAACASTKSGPADYTNADRGNQPAPDVQSSTTVVTPEPAPITTNSTPQGSVLDHNSPDQQIVHP
jgi:hypothetical protein